MEWGRLGRVGHTEFQEWNQGLKLEWRIEKQWIQSKGLGNKHGSRGNVKCRNSNSIGDKGTHQGGMGVNSDGFL